MKGFVDQRVRMVFDNGVEVVATLLFAMEDMDRSQHLVSDRVEWSNDPREFATAEDSAFHAEGESLVSIDAAVDQGG